MTLGAALIGFAGGYLAYRSSREAAHLGYEGTRLSLSHETAEAWRTRLIEAAAAVTGDATALFFQIGDALDEVDEGSDHHAPEVSEQTSDRLWELVDAMQKKATLVSILYGDKSEVGIHNQGMLDCFGSCLHSLRGASALEAASPDAKERWKQAKAGSDAASDEMDAFMKAVHDEIAPTDGIVSRRP